MRSVIAMALVLAFASIGFAHEGCSNGGGGTVPAETFILRDPVGYAMRQSTIVVRQERPIVFHDVRRDQRFHEIRPIIHRGVDVNVGRFNLNVGRSFIR